jgi:hypothetical protein
MNTLEQAKDIFINNNLDKSLFDSKKLRTNSLLYMVYWIDRLKNNLEEQAAMKDNLFQYLNRTNISLEQVNHIVSIANSPSLVHLSDEYVNKQIVPVSTVDLVVQDNSQQVLLLERTKFPKGLSLPGGLVEESDESNELGLDAKTFAALRIAGEKILQLKNNETIYKKLTKENGELFYCVHNKDKTKQIIIHPQNIYGYAIKENVRSVIRPSDPRHLVDTIGFKCEIIKNETTHKNYIWESKSALLDNAIVHPIKNFSFYHHKEIILHTLGKTSVEEQMNFDEAKFIRSIIDHPVEVYHDISKRFLDNRYNTNTSFPELFPTVNKIFNGLFSDDINKLCEENSLFIGFRDKVANSLRHVSLKNRVFCPYLPTIHAIFDGIAFFDVVARHKKQFYDDIDSSSIIEHNPKQKKDAAYHMYKYQYRKNELLGKVPDEIIIPTFTNLSATDLMKVRGIPIRFVGLSKNFIYVDEFEQSPEEFLMHDINHSYRMSVEDDKYLESSQLSKENFIAQQNCFIKDYLSSIKISKDDNEITKELKKIKKIILFEICHEDARPLFPEVVLSCLIKKEGGETKFELPIIDEKTQYMDIVDVLDTEISTLSYVRNKLQYGFYDQVDNQNQHIVKPEYRKSTFIAQAAFDMIHELSIMLNKKVEVDYEYVLKRVCSVGPNNVHEPIEKDELVEQYNDGAEFLNPKRYQSNQKK